MELNTEILYKRMYCECIEYQVMKLNLFNSVILDKSIVGINDIFMKYASRNFGERDIKLQYKNLSWIQGHQSWGKG